MRLSFKLNNAGFKTAAITMAVTTIAFAAPVSAHDNGYNHQHQNSGSDQILGAGIGAIAGGVLGSQLAGNGARTEGSVLGAVLGGVAGAAIAGDGQSNRRYYNGGQVYNPQTGYYQSGGYQQGYQGGYYQQPRTTYGYASGYQQPVYQQPVYPQTTYRTTYQYSSPQYRPTYNPYYSVPRTGVSINIGTGGYYGRPVYRNNGYRTHPRHNQRRRHNNRRRHGH